MSEVGMSFDQQLGELLRLHRVSAGVSQRDLSERLGIPLRDLRQVEAGRTGISVQTLVELSYALGISSATLLDQFDRRAAYIDPPASNVDEACRSLLASNRGRQLIRAMATCRHPEVLDAVFRLLIANAIHVIPEDTELKAAHV